MEIIMEVSTWVGSFWTYDIYDVRLQSEEMLYEIQRYDVMFIKNLGEIIVDDVKFNGSFVTINCTYMGGFAGGENKFAEAPWA